MPMIQTLALCSIYTETAMVRLNGLRKVDTEAAGRILGRVGEVED